MAISNQIQRLTTLRNNIRTKLINLGILPAASTSATLSECYNVLSSVTGLGASSYTPTTVSQVIPSGRYLSGAQTINAIPSAYIIPSGTVVLSSSGMFDVGSYASADVTVTGGPSGMYVDYGNVSTYSQSSHCYLTGGSVTVKNAGTVIPYALLAEEGHQHHAGRVTSVNNYVENLSDIEHIGAMAFYNTTFMNGLNVSIITFDKCLTVYSSAFYKTNFRCVSQWNEGFFLSSVVLSFPSLVTLGDGAFAFCERVSAVYMPVLESVPNECFGNISNVFEVSLPMCKTIGYNAFINDTIQRIDLPEATMISSSAFMTCLSLSFASLPKVKELKANVFYGCKSLVSIYAPQLTSISIGCFASMNPACGITVADFPQVTNIGLQAFYGCSNLSRINFTNLSQIVNAQSIFYYCISLESVYLPNLQLLSNVGNMFGMCYSVSSVDLPKLTLLSGAEIFAFNYSLASVHVPELVRMQGNSIFTNCSKLSEFYAPKLESMSGLNIFYNCSILNTISFPMLSYISGWNIFSGTAIERAEFPELTTAISSVFTNMSLLSQISLPKLATISGALFSPCPKLQAIDLPQYTYTSLISYIFDRCTSLSVVSMPKTSRLSGQYMFRSCHHLISIFLLGSSVCNLGNTVPITFPSTPISNYSTSAGRWGSVFVPASLLAQYKAATNWTTISSKIFAYEDYFS